MSLFGVFADLLILAQNYGKTSGGTFATGDFNGDGAVNFNDLLVLVQNFGTGTAAASRLAPALLRRGTYSRSSAGR